MRSIVFAVCILNFFAWVAIPGGRARLDPLDVKLVSPASSPNGKPVEIKTMIAIVKAFMARTKKRDHFVTDDKRVYLVVPPAVFEKLPRKLNGITFERFEGTPNAPKNTVPYVTFTGWEGDEQVVSVVCIAYFVGGNDGGCYDVYQKTAGKWNLAKSDCFASAS